MTGLHIDGRATLGRFVLDVDLDVGAGESLAVLGPNGAGKSTLIRVLAGLHPLESGEVRIGGEVVDAPATGEWVPPEARSIGVVFQGLLLFPHLDVTDNVGFGVRARGGGRDEARRTAIGWLERLGVGHLAGAWPRELSGGEAQRVALARALAPEPVALLLDEPLSALDAEVRADVRRLIRDHLRSHEGPRVVVTHDPLDAAALAERVVVLEGGRVTAQGSLADLVAHPRTAWAAELAGTNLLRATSDASGLRLDQGGRLLAAEACPPGPVLVAVRPAAVALHRAHPEGSPRNVWEAVVAEVEGWAERARVRLDGPIPLVAEVTAAAVTELDLRPGQAVWASVKATEIAVYPA
ncbi:MAG: ABC transporter ATP-binding protein [Acidimicrobiales bacterium]